MSCMFICENFQCLGDSGERENPQLMKSQENYPDAVRPLVLYAWRITGCHYPIHQQRQLWDNKIKRSHHPLWLLFKWLTILCVRTQKPPNSRNTSTLLFTLFWNQNIKLDKFCPEPYLVLFHRYVWPSHFGSFAFLSSVRPAVRTRSRAATKQPVDWQLVVTDFSVYSSIFYPATTINVVVFSFKAKLFRFLPVIFTYLLFACL